MSATQANPGQGTLVIAAKKTPPGLFAPIVIRNRKTGDGLRYTISGEWGPTFIQWDRSLDPSARYDAIMTKDKLFNVASEPKPN